MLCRGSISLAAPSEYSLVLCIFILSLSLSLSLSLHFHPFRDTAKFAAVLWPFLQSIWEYVFRALAPCSVTGANEASTGLPYIIAFAGSNWQGPRICAAAGLGAG